MSVHFLELRFDFFHVDFVGIDEVVLVCLENVVHLTLEIYTEFLEFRKRGDYC